MTFRHPMHALVALCLTGVLLAGCADPELDVLRGRLETMRTSAGSAPVATDVPEFERPELTATGLSEQDFGANPFLALNQSRCPAAWAADTPVAALILRATQARENERLAHFERIDGTALEVPLGGIFGRECMRLVAMTQDSVQLLGVDGIRHGIRASAKAR